MGKSPTTKDDAQALFQSLRSAYSATPTNLKIIDLYVVFAVFTALVQISPTLCLKFGRIVHCLKLVGYSLVFHLKFHGSGDVLDLNVARSKVIFRLDVGSSMKANVIDVEIHKPDSGTHNKKSILSSHPICSK
ncbi:hypothetical protein L6452_32441 [Arctium lappa]|uniref:Uncharacterized protein n=1 Tax=Arctium lappa TaxID=4217 RepID=A0ACB8Z5G9_ARCLA|nr:hypothetical protein L6452_32441 [Arctium lappa]